MENLLEFSNQFPFLKIKLSNKLVKDSVVKSTLQFITYDIVKPAEMSSLQWDIGMVGIFSEEEIELARDFKSRRPLSFFIICGKKINAGDAYYVLDFEEVGPLRDLLTWLNSIVAEQRKSDFIKKEYSRFEEVIQNCENFQDMAIKELARKNGKSGADATFYREATDDFQSNYENLVTSKDLDQFERELGKLIKKHQLVGKAEFLEEKDIFEYLLEDQRDLFIPMNSDTDGFIHLGDCKMDEMATSYLIFLIYSSYEIYFTRMRIQEEEADAINLWEEAFLKIPVPVSMFTSEGELVLHNTMFREIEILPKECLSFKDKDKFERKNVVYEVNRKKVENEGRTFNLFVFKSEESVREMEKANSQKTISTEELGIISSSIAHELNNPLAGILAAIGLLELEDDLDNESIEALADMKSSATRCKELIGVFLGFSRASTTQNLDGRLCDSLIQAQGLLRFRMIESNVRIDIDFAKSKYDFESKVNPSVAAMIFYLMLSEVLTSYSHHRLVMGEESNLIHGKYSERKDKVEIIFDKSFDFKSSISKSKLIQHLADLEGLNINLTESGISLTQFMLT